MVAFLLASLLAQDTSKGIAYDIHVRLDPEMCSMSVEVEIEVPAGTTETLELPVQLGEEMGEPELFLNGEKVEPFRTDVRDGSMNNIVTRFIKFDPNRQNTIKATYTTTKNTGFVYKLGKYASYAGGPNVSWYPSTGGRVVTADMTFDVPKGQVVKATGKLIETKVAGDRVIFTFHSAKAATMSFAIGPYIVYRDDSGRLPVALYLFKERDWTSKAIKMLREVADTLEDWFGPYPFDEMAIVEVEPDAGRVAGFAGASLEGFLLATPYFIDGKGDGPNLAFIGHELGHAWWGHQIKHAGGAGNYMVSEAMAQFGSLKAVEAIDGAVLARRYRTTGYPGYIPSQSGQGGLRTMLAGYDPELAKLTGNKAHGFSDAKGFQIYHQLEQVVGTEKLKLAFRKVQSEYAWQRLNSDKLFELIGEYAGTDLDWFYEQWFNSSGAPRWGVRWRQKGDKLSIDIDQIGEKPFRFVTEIEAVFEDGSKRRWPFEMRSDLAALEFSVGKKVRSVVLDPDWDVFHWDSSLVDLEDKQK